MLNYVVILWSRLGIDPKPWLHDALVRHKRVGVCLKSDPVGVPAQRVLQVMLGDGNGSMAQVSLGVRFRGTYPLERTRQKLSARQKDICSSTV